MNLLCRIFGHKPPVYAKTGWWSPGEQYAKVSLDGVDGTGTQHAFVHGVCARCEKKFMVARIHLPRDQEEIASV
jgi:hypothetical protein